MLNIFKHLENIKGKPIPLVFKLINNLPLVDDDLTVNYHLVLTNTNIERLPDNLTVNKHLNLTKSKIKQLPKNLTVNGALSISYTDIETIPECLKVDDKLFCRNTKVATDIQNNPFLLCEYKKQVKGKIHYE